jgi:hypothetical protein
VGFGKLASRLAAFAGIVEMFGSDTLSTKLP